MADSGSESVRFKGRKPLRYEHLWKKKRRKLQKDSGVAYETYKSESKPAKELEPISCSVKYTQWAGKDLKILPKSLEVL